MLSGGPVCGDPEVSATQRDSFPDPDGDGRAVPGEQIDYETVIANLGTTAAAGLRFVSPVPADTALTGDVRSTPLARDDGYAAVGNVGLEVPVGMGLLANDFDLGPTPPVVVAGSGATSAGGAVMVNPDGSFSYSPPAGFTGTDTFAYTIADESGAVLPAPATGSNAASVAITVSGTIWFIDSTAAAGGDGALASPFATLAEHEANGSGQDGDGIFLAEGSYAGGIALRDGQRLIGAGSSQSLDAALGITLPPGSRMLPATGGTKPTIGNPSGDGIVLASGNTVRGLAVSTTTSTSDGISGAGVGTLTIAEVSVMGAGGGVDLSNGTLAVSFESISSSGSDHGIELTNIDGTFEVLGDGATVGSGGTLDGHIYGVRLSNVSGVSLRHMIVTNSAEDGIRGDEIDGFALIGSRVVNFGTSGSAGLAPGDTTLESEPESGMDFRGLTGVVTIQDSVIGPDNRFELSSFPPAPENHGIQVFNQDDLPVAITITGSSFARISNSPVFVQGDNSDATVVVDGAASPNSFTEFNGVGIDVQDRTDKTDNSRLAVEVRGSMFTDGAIGARWSASGGSDVRGQFVGNTLSGTTDTAVRALGNDGSLTTNSEVHTLVANNDLGGDGNASGGLFQVARRGSEHFVLNGEPGASPAAPSNTNCGPIVIESSRGAVMHHTAHGNNVQGDAAPPYFVFAALQVQLVKDAAGPGATLNQDIQGNSFTLRNAAANAVDAVYFDDNADSAHAHTFEGFSGTTLDQAGTFLTDGNTVDGSGSSADSPLGSGVNFFFGAAQVPAAFSDADNDVDLPVFP